jgi:hypothetical protein
MTDWYEEFIEPGIREIVRRLRNEGVNTTCSCEHIGEVEAEYSPDGVIMQADNTVFNWLAEIGKPKTYKVTVTIERINGCAYSTLRITGLPKTRGK